MEEIEMSRYHAGQEASATVNSEFFPLCLNRSRGTASCSHDDPHLLCCAVHFQWRHRAFIIKWPTQIACHGWWCCKQCVLCRGICACDLDSRLKCGSLEMSAQPSVWSSTIFSTSQLFHTSQARLPPRGEPIVLVCLQYPNLVRGSLKLACSPFLITALSHLVWAASCVSLHATKRCCWCDYKKAGRAGIFPCLALLGGRSDSGALDLGSQAVDWIFHDQGRQGGMVQCQSAVVQPKTCTGSYVMSATLYYLIF